MLTYIVALGTIASIYGVMALGLNVMWGMAGMVNLGIVGFFAIGAYASALTTTALHWPIAAGIAVGAVVSAAVGMAACHGVRRLRDDYLAIVTLGLAEVVRIVADNEVWLTRGSDGISGIPQPLKAVFGNRFDLFYLALCLVAFAAAYAVAELAGTSPFGRVLRAIRDDRDVAAAAGKRVSAFQARAFGLGSLMAGLAGALYGHYTSYIAPEIFVPSLTIYIFLAVTAGGRGNNLGTVLGAFVVVVFLEASRFLGGALPFMSPEQIAAGRGMLIGLAFLVTLRFRPQGLLPERTGASRRSVAVGPR